MAGKVCKMRIKTFFLRFIAFSLVIFLIWIFIGKFYLFMIAYASKYILIAMGYKVSLITTGDSPFLIYKGVEMGMKGSHLSNFNIVSLIALILAVPGIELKKRVNMLTIGIPAIFLLHLVDFVSHVPMYFDKSEFAGMIVASIAVGGMALPFLIWFALAHKELFKEINEKKITKEQITNK